MKSYYVVCLDDNGQLVFATQRAFMSRREAESYLGTVSYGRDAFIVTRVED